MRYLKMRPALWDSLGLLLPKQTRRERERKAGKHAQPDTTQGPGRKEVPPGRKDQSRQDQANSPPRHRRRPNLVLVAGHTRK